MNTKLLKISNTGITFHAIATELVSNTQEERNLLTAAGYDQTAQDRNILLTPIDGAASESRTMTEAQLYINEYWCQITSGDTIDVAHGCSFKQIIR